MATQEAATNQGPTHSAVQHGAGNNQSSPIQQQSPAGYRQLLDGDVRRIMPQCGPDTLAVFAVIAAHEDSRGVAFPSLLTIARMCDIDDVRTVKAHIRKLCEVGHIEATDAKPPFRVIHGDGSHGFTPIVKRFIESNVAPHDDLRTMEVPEWVPDGPEKVWVGPKPRKKHRYVWIHPVSSGIGATGLGFYYGMIAAARGAGACCRDGRMKFRMPVERLRLLLGMSRGQFDRVRPIIEGHHADLLRSAQVGKSVEWDVRVQTVPQSSQKMQDSPAIITKNAGQPPQSSQKMLHEVDLDSEVDFEPEVHKSNTGSEHDRRCFADAAATQTFSRSETQNPTAAVCSEPADVPEPAEPPTHDDCGCIGGFLIVADAEGRTGTKRCERYFTWRKWQAAEEKAKREAERQQEFAATPFFDLLNTDLFGTRSRTPALPALPPAPVIEVEWRDPKPSAPVRQREAGEVIPAAMYRELWKRLETESGVFMDDWDKDTRIRVDGMLRKGGVARFGTDRFHRALKDAISEQWESKHGHCHEDDGCDGSCGHNPDQCDGFPDYIDTPKALLDLVGNAVQLLTGDERFGRNRGNRCPNAVEEMYAA